MHPSRITHVETKSGFARCCDADSQASNSTVYLDAAAMTTCWPLLMTCGFTGSLFRAEKRKHRICKLCRVNRVFPSTNPRPSRSSAQWKEARVAIEPALGKGGWDLLACNKRTRTRRPRRHCCIVKPRMRVGSSVLGRDEALRLLICLRKRSASPDLFL